MTEKTDTSPSRQANVAPPKPVRHNDDARSSMPERHDAARRQSPADKPGRQPGEGETPVG